MNARAEAAKLLKEVVVAGKSLSALTEKIAAHPEKAFIMELCYGVCRFYPRLVFFAKKLLQKPIKNKEKEVELLICIGFYQLVYLKTPPHAAVAETVNAAKVLQKPWAVNLINAVLRQGIRQLQDLQQEADKHREVCYAHPAWLIDKIRRAWPDHWQAVLQANNQHPPMSLRVNTRKLSRQAYLDKYAIQGEIFPYNTCGIILEKPVPIPALAGFAAGEVSVQDAAAQMAALLLDLKPGLSVLDACAAPGGKTAHISETQPDLRKHVALEIDAARAEKIRENLRRLQVRADVRVADVLTVSAWQGQDRFDRILLDAPCSATGVIRRHPDIKILRRPEDIAQLAATQLALLRALWPALKEGGRLLYATCSIIPDENVAVMEKFLAARPDAKELEISAPWGLPQKHGRQILPGEAAMDGFYYCYLEKIRG